ncbi:hypothetical protein [Paenibacillus tianmuensis]|uniref:hypothetical protein n=1 Tax=Paenibacillus tianmuensis TaxID=624147 RepID=UPI000A9F2025|nr:hypothetical protein [Paenibacillus tianmuensis]
MACTTGAYASPTGWLILSSATTCGRKRFRIAFERSVWITLLLIVAYAGAKIAESKTERSKSPSRLTRY